MTYSPAVEALLARHAKACEFKQPHDPDAVSRHIKQWIANCGGPAVAVECCPDWAWAASAARAASAAWDASAARAASAASAARAASAAWAASAARAARAASAARAARAAWAASAAWDAWDASAVACLVVGAAEIGEADEQSKWDPTLSALESGAWLWWVQEKRISYVPLPIIFHGLGRLHREDGPAIVSLDWSEYFLRGVLVDEQIVMRPQTQTIEQIRGEKNEEVKRLRIERFGWPGYLHGINATRIDKRRNDIEGTREALYRADGHCVLVCACPSTSKVFSLECPPNIETCHAAQSYLSSGLSSRIISAA